MPFNIATPFFAQDPTELILEPLMMLLPLRRVNLLLEEVGAQAGP